MEEKLVITALPELTDDETWLNIIKHYKRGTCDWQLASEIETHLWEYFKMYLLSHNRYFFNHPMLELLACVIKDNVYTLSDPVYFYRARVDTSGELFDEWTDYTKLRIAKGEMEYLSKYGAGPALIQKAQDELASLQKDPRLGQISERIKTGFHGFDIDGSSAPPSSKASSGRCNLQGVSYLYTALEEHTAIAEIRPSINDIISVATLSPVEELKFVYLDYDPNAVVYGKDLLFNQIQREYARLNRDKKDDYTVTQYMTSFLEFLGYDGLCFRSSLVLDGMNFVIFNPKKCKVLCSRLLHLSEVKYSYTQLKV